MAIEIMGGEIVSTRGTVVTYKQRCEKCGYVAPLNKTTLVPAYGTKGARAFTCSECGNRQEVELRWYHSATQQ